MLVQLTIENFGCFRDETTLSFRALAGVAHPPGQVVEVQGVGPVLRTVAFYGANASGKTTVLKAVDWLTILMREGVPVGLTAPSPAFKLSDARSTPTRVEAHFVDTAGSRWAYSLAMGGGQVQEEWLERVVDDVAVIVFERTSGQGKQPAVTWGPGLGLNQARATFYDFIAQGTRHEQPLLAELWARNAYELERVHTWALFSSLEMPSWERARQWGDATAAFATLLARPRFRAWAAEAIGVAGAGVTALDLDTQDDRLRSAWNKGTELQYADARSAMTAPNNRIRFRAADGVLEWEDLSDGTIRLIELGRETADLTFTGGRLVDELERSLHPALARWVVQDWQARRDDEGEVPYAQLLFTTHELHLLDEALLGGLPAHRLQTRAPRPPRSGPAHQLLGRSIRRDPADPRSRPSGNGRGAEPMRRPPSALVERDYGHRDASLILICAEGRGDEVAYFEQLKALPGLVDRRRVRVLVTSPPDDKSAPQHVYDKAAAVVESVEKPGIDEVWLVVDRDRWRGALSEVGAAARQRGWTFTVSNPCFQVWLLFHFFPTPPGGTCDALKAEWGRARQARAPGGYSLNVEDVRRATDNAAAWETGHPSDGFLPHHPGTHVHHLVSRLLHPSVG